MSESAATGGACGIVNGRMGGYGHLSAKQQEKLQLLLVTDYIRLLEETRTIYKVEEVHWRVPGSVVTALCKEFVVEVSFENRTTPLVSCSCSSSKESRCLHAAALIFYLVERQPIAKVGEAEPKAQSAGAISQLVHKKVPGHQKAMAKKFLQSADQWFAEKVEKINAGNLSRLCGRATYWGFNEQILRLFPVGLPAESPEEFLACLFIAAHKMGMQLPAPVSDAVDGALVEGLQKKWKEEEAVGEWKNLLGKWSADKSPTMVPEMRLRLSPEGARVEFRLEGEAEFQKAKRSQIEPWFNALRRGEIGKFPRGAELVLWALADRYGYFQKASPGPGEEKLVESLSQLFASPELFARHVAGEDGQPLTIEENPLRWLLGEPEEENYYRLELVDAEGQSLPRPVAILPGRTKHYVTPYAVYPVERWPRGMDYDKLPMRIPARAFESNQGLSALRLLGLPIPAKLAPRVRVLKPTVIVQAEIVSPSFSKSDYLQVISRGTYQTSDVPDMLWNGDTWCEVASRAEGVQEAGDLLQIDNTVLDEVGAWLKELLAKAVFVHQGEVRLEQRVSSKDWPDHFTAWVARRPAGCEVQLSGELASLADGKVAGSVRLDIEESVQGMDWFDLNVALQVSDTELTQEEIDLLLKAQGRWVRLKGKGWRKLELEINEEQRAELAAMGLAAQDFRGEKQRLHALQLGALAKTGAKYLGADRVAKVQRRIEEIKTRVTPAVPEGITAMMRPYQVEGFHFLSYLTENNFGGVLADDMGLGKTLQALAWIAWLREAKQLAEPVLVICPKSVQDNWRVESAKFFPGLKVAVWTRDTAGKFGHDGSVDLLVIHYAQLRSHSELLTSRSWGAVVLDEAQAVKNPTSQTARAACALVAARRLALTGTPIENRLMDLWSIFAFAMPGVLGNRTSFSKHYDRRDDPLARRRLAARTRPFLLRRAKSEVERELPERIEDDLVIEFDGTQAALYQAELKRARAMMLNLATDRQLDKLRFNILTSLLRLRQICCHPKLIGFGEDGKKKSPRSKAKLPTSSAAEDEDAGSTGSAKVSALLDLVEPLMEEGHKVLVFSQFVQMLEIIQQEMAARAWTTFKLTGETEDRGPLVESFQNHDGGAVFLISLKAGGSGLNLTAASYVVLFDPWWNPAVEAQAIDRTHRIGQKKTVFAYRLLIKGTIEEKIRLLQKHKGALAQDILGEENFAQALTLDDFRFLLGE